MQRQNMGLSGFKTEVDANSIVNQHQNVNATSSGGGGNSSSAAGTGATAGTSSTVTTTSTTSVTAALDFTAPQSTNMSVELCLVCGDRASGRHYGAISCEGCKGFFKRSIRKQLGYQCRGTMNCEVTKHHRNRCQFCRLQKCLASGMRSDSVQHERKPIVDKKETPLSMTTSTVASGGSSSGAVSSASGTSMTGGGSNLKCSTSPVYQQRLKQQQQQQQQSSTSPSAAAAVAAVAAASSSAALFSNAAAAAAAFTLDNNLQCVLPMGLNFAELTHTLMLATQQQQQQQLNASQQQQQQQSSTPTPLCYSPELTKAEVLISNSGGSGSVGGGSAGGTGGVGSNLGVSAGSAGSNAIADDEDDDEDDSFDNRSTLCMHKLSSVANNNNNININTSSNNNLNIGVQHLNLESLPPNPAAAVSLIQSSLDKRVIDKALHLLTPIQQQLERMAIAAAATTVNDASNETSNDLHIKDEINEDDMTGDADGEVDNGEGEDDSEDEHDFLLMDLEFRGSCSNNDGAKDFVLNNCIFDVELLTSLQAPFNLQAPTLVSAYLNIHYVCEVGSRIIFLSVYWLRKIAAFEELNERSQIKLLRTGWPALLAIALAQCNHLAVSTIIATLINNVRQLAQIEKIEPKKIRQLSEHIARLHAFIQELLALNVTDMEYALLRLAVIFNPHVLMRTKERNVRNYVRCVQLYALSSLREEAEMVSKLNDTPAASITGSKLSQFSPSESRFNALVMCLQPLSALDSETIEELFFANLIGQIQVDNMIPTILTLGANVGI